MSAEQPAGAGEALAFDETAPAPDPPSEQPPPVAPINVFGLYFDVTPTPVMTTPNWQKVATTMYLLLASLFFMMLIQEPMLLH